MILTLFLALQSLARLGASVLGLDATPQNVVEALRHSGADPSLRDRVQYRATTAEQLLEEGALVF